MITQIFSEYYMIMKAITDEICRSFELPHSIFTAMKGGTINL